MLRKFRDFVFYLVFLSVSVLLLLEVCYRFYVVDFYKGSLIGLNSEEDLMPIKDHPTILVFGDSFTADTNSYIKHLRENMPNYRIINSAVAGTSIRQHSLMAKRRIKRFAPEVLIYQIYVGNDLLEYRHPTSGKNISVMRKLYWWLSDRLMVVGYINAKLPQLKAVFVADPNPGSGAKLSSDFAVEKYNRRTQMQFRIEPDLLEHTVLLKGERGIDFRAYSEELAVLLELAPADCKIVIMVMPHCAQLGAPYLERMEELGAVFEDKPAFLEVNYPFFDDLNRTLSKDGRHFYNVLEYLRDEDGEHSFYYENDPHLNPAGQQLVGEKLVSFFEQRNWK